VAPYPPGIPVLAPGERIDQGVWECLLEIREKKLKVQGPEDSSLQELRVI